MKRNLSEKMLLQIIKRKKSSDINRVDLDHDPHQNQNYPTCIRNKRFLITVNVLGSSGPLRFLAFEDDLVGGVIHACLKIYAREGRLPLLGSDPNNFLLYSTNTAGTGVDFLNPWDSIGSSEVRNFILCKKVVHPNMMEGRSSSEMFSAACSRRKGIMNGRKWKAWLEKALFLV